MGFGRRIFSFRSIIVIAIASIGTVTASPSLIPFLAEASGQRSLGNFLVTVAPSSMIMSQGAFANSTVELVSIGGFRGTVSLYTDTTGNYFGAVFASRAVTITSGGAATTTLRLRAPTSASKAYTIIVTGTANQNQRRTISSSTTLNVSVVSNSDFEINANPQGVNETSGTSMSVGIVLDSVNGFSGKVSLTTTVPFGFISAMGGQNMIALVSGGTNSTTLVISSTQAALPGKYNITVTATSGQRTHSILIHVTITDPPIESVLLAGTGLSSSSNLTLSLENLGNAPTTLIGYSITDSLGDTWSLNTWAGPVIQPSTIGSGNILIGTSCGSCTYTGILFGFQQFSHGQTYTVVLTAATGTRFTFSVRVE